MGGADRWEWGRNLHDWRPLYAERHRLARLGPLPAPPTDPAGWSKYGFDREDRLVSVERHHAFGRVDVDRFTIAAAGGVTGEHRDFRGHVTHSRIERDGAGRVVAWRWASLAGPVEEAYTYAEGRLVRVVARAPGDEGTVFDVTWGDDGLRRVTSEISGSGRRAVVWERENRPIEELAAEVGAALVHAVRDRLRQVAWEAPAWTLLLVKGGGYDALPPELVVGVGRHWLGEAGRELPVLQARDERSLGGGEDPLALLDPTLNRSCRRLAQQARAGGSAQILHDLLRDLGRQLAADPQALPLPKEPGFFVLVTDLDEGVHPSDLAGLSPESVSRLRRAGLVR